MIDRDNVPLSMRQAKERIAWAAQAYRAWK
jgi:hypothetical protein